MEVYLNLHEEINKHGSKMIKNLMLAAVKVA